jgi:hypothetical protein
MKKKLLIVCLSILYANICHSQDLEESKTKQIEITENIFYQVGKNIFKEHKLFFRKEKFQDGPWHESFRVNEKDLLSSLDTIIENSAVKVESRFSRNYLNLESCFSENIENPNPIFAITILAQNLTNEKGDGIEVDFVPNLGFGLESYSGFENGQSIYRKWKTLIAKFPLKDSVKSITGNIKFLASFVSDYDVIKITANDIGKEIRFSDVSYKVIDIKSNLLILSPTELNDKGTDFEFLNLDLSEDNEYKQIPVFELQQRKENGEEIDMATASGVGKLTIPKTIYDIFEEKPEIEFSELQEIIHEDLVKAFASDNPKKGLSNYLGPNYIIVKSAGPIENLYIYKPKYGIQKEFEIKL